jgi:hypothetical protein
MGAKEQKIPASKATKDQGCVALTEQSGSFQTGFTGVKRPTLGELEPRYESPEGGTRSNLARPAPPLHIQSWNHSFDSNFISATTHANRQLTSASNLQA